MGMLRWVTTALGAVVLTGCGFHFAGDRPLPPLMARVSIDVVQPYAVSEPPVESSLRTRLQRRGAEVVEHAGSDVTLLRLTDLTETRETLSIGPDGKALEFLLTTRLTYAASHGDRSLIAPTQIQVSRDYSFDQEEVLAKEAEEERLRNVMQSDLADMLLLQLDARLGSIPVDAVGP